MTITESKRIGHENDGPVHYEKHKIFLYKEDFDGFSEGLQRAVDHIRELQGTGAYRTADSNRKQSRELMDSEGGSDSSATSSNFSFDDLDQDH